MKKITFFSFIIFFFFPFLYAQMETPGESYGCLFSFLKNYPVIELSEEEAIQTEAYKKSESLSRLKTDVEPGIEYSLDISYQNNGVWDTLSDGTKIWRIGFSSKTPGILSLIFSSYKLQPGVKLFVYTENCKNIRGAFTYKNNKPFGSLALAPLEGKTLIVEMQVKSFQKNPGELVIGTMYKKPRSKTKTTLQHPKGFGASDTCHIDINCVSNDMLQKVKKSVVRILYLGDEYCTGTLVNNSNNDRKAYVLTAWHCMKTESWANNAVFYFNYESPYCEGPDNMNLKSISGATIKASTYNLLDFCLLELTQVPNLNYKPYYAGWDRLPGAPQNSYSIHHPWGDVKKISLDNDPATTDDFGEGFDYNTHWLIGDWEVGTTEQGSSGGPLFNQNYYLVGTLTGGDANCVNSVNDYYQKLYHSWEDYADTSQQLKYWLDPANTGTGILSGFDPYAYVLNNGDTLRNISPEESVVLETDEDGGFIAGTNQYGIEEFAESFAMDSAKTLLGAIINPAKITITSENSEIYLKVWDGNMAPQSLLYTQAVNLNDLEEFQKTYIEFSIPVSIPKDFFIGYQIPGNPGDTFAMATAVNRAPEGINTAYVKDNPNWRSMTDFAGINTSLDIQPVVYDTLEITNKIDTNETQEDFTIYPNPATNQVTIKFNLIMTGTIDIKVFSMDGKLADHAQKDILTDEIQYNFNKFTEGLYVFQITVEDKIHRKLIVINK